MRETLPSSDALDNDDGNQSDGHHTAAPSAKGTRTAAPPQVRSWRLVVAYHGAKFQGWQKQEGTRTVQGALEDALTKIAGERVNVRGAGRTDAGVHARGQLVSTTFRSRIGPEKAMMAFNSQLPKDLSIVDAVEVPAGFDAKRDSIAKKYIYRLHHALFYDPFDGGTRWQIRHALDVEKMIQAAPAFIGEHDFEAFRSAQCDAAHARRFVWMVAVRHLHPLVEIEVRGNAFCRNMVRVMAGTLTDIGRGRIPVDAIPSILASRDRTKAGITAPAHGLTMERVYLPEDAVEAAIPEGAVFPGWPNKKPRWSPEEGDDDDGDDDDDDDGDGDGNDDDGDDDDDGDGNDDGNDAPSP